VVLGRRGGSRNPPMEGKDGGGGVEGEKIDRKGKEGDFRKGKKKTLFSEKV